MTSLWILGLQNNLSGEREYFSGKHSRLGVWLRVLLLRTRDLSPDHVLPHIILLGQVEEFADLGSPLGTKTFGDDGVGQSGDLVLALLDDDHGEDSNIGADDAATNGLALALTGAADTVARVAVGEEETNTVGYKDTLLHGETLLIVSASDAENVALPLIAQRVSRNLLRDLLVVEDTANSRYECEYLDRVSIVEYMHALMPLVVKVEELLGPSSGVYAQRMRMPIFDNTHSVTH